MTIVITALDNIKLTSEDTNPETQLTYGVLLNDTMERNKDKMAKAFSDLVVFGYCTMPEFTL